MWSLGVEFWAKMSEDLTEIQAEKDKKSDQLNRPKTAFLEPLCRFILS